MLAGSFSFTYFVLTVLIVMLDIRLSFVSPNYLYYTTVYYFLQQAF